MKPLSRAAPPAAIAIGLELRTARLRAKFGVRQLARRADVNPAQLSSWELGERIPSPDYVSFLVGLLHLPTTEYRRLRSLAADARRENHIEPEQDAAERLAAAYEHMAYRIVEWVPAFIPTRLQSPEYAQERQEQTTSTDLDQEPQSGRLELDPLPLPNPLTRESFLSMRSVRNPVLSRTAMITQNELLLRLLHHSRERICLVTADPGDLPAFAVYQIRGRTPTVALQQAGCTVYLTSDQATGAYLRAARRFASEALTPAQTADAIKRAVHDLSTDRPYQRLSETTSRSGISATGHH
ncbi:Scr1 family TA system antitoxin-like transcriptional regulator [Amycolatopsis jejuensis]|uniref:Scr1 family TA system antitoxin-like transcriptional regulator n=1 Tax=Amycolatopsis jejuensis TaxID=330084 RepID=UPI00138E1877|nr:Scr1 family TA system antitoxin-like transcriptional regulator [Amycolatopsis jejuensis]